MEIEIKLDPQYKIPKIIILTEKVTEEINTITEKLSERSPQFISGFRDNILKILEQDEIIRIYSNSGRVIAVTEDGEYYLRQRLYEMEEQLDSSVFVRISNSEIINLKKVKSFDMSFTGTICVSMADSAVTYASRRYVSKIKKKLGV
ncbi:MAG: LytTR family transcriptional regulator [Oscillospiraceae bacterium]|nr:LytTR family transcriptional regulator [Oscillospiraceae bacterium]